MITYSFDAIRKAVLAQPMTNGIMITERELMSHFRRREIMDARALITVLAFKYMHDPSYPKVGRLLDRDHASIWSLKRRFDRQRAHYEPLLTAIEAQLLRTLPILRGHNEAA
jgi:chromosomal replication initiation ATPase DnaA